MSHSLVLGAFLLNLISSQSNVAAATNSNQPEKPHVIAVIRKVAVFTEKQEAEKEKRIGFSTKNFCLIALQSKEPNLVIQDSDGKLIPINEYCKEFSTTSPVAASPQNASYASHQGDSTGNSYIRKLGGQTRWIAPAEFCESEARAKTTCDKMISIIYNKTAQPSKTLGDYCKGYMKNFQCPK